MAVRSDTDTVDEIPLSAGGIRPIESLSSRVQIDFAGVSHVGLVRSNNEDHFLVARFDRTMQTLLTNLPAGAVPQPHGETVYGLLVADGMGGQAAGEVASRLAITTLVDLVVHTPDWVMRLEDPRFLEEVMSRMEQRLRQLAEKLAEHARHDPSLSGMGTTMTVTASLGADLIVGHVGDSRAYLFRQGRLHRLTRDHTLAQSMLDAGLIGADEVARHPMRHLLTSSIGARDDEVCVDVHPVQLDDGDQVLLCTDGLTEMVPDELIATELQSAATADAACNALLELALERGGKDNVTVVLGRYRIPPPAAE